MEMLVLYHRRAAKARFLIHKVWKQSKSQTKIRSLAPNGLLKEIFAHMREVPNLVGNGPYDANYKDER